MRHSEKIDLIAAALAQAQGEIKAAIKTRVNPLYNSRYADLATIVEVVREPLSRAGIARVQTCEGFRAIEAGAVVVVQTLLVHKSGQWIRFRTEVPLAKRDAHGYGSAVTYARRFALAAACGVAPDDDDDGVAAVERSGASATSGPINSEQLATLERLFVESGADVNSACEYYKVGGIRDLPSDLYPDLVSKLKQRIARRKQKSARPAPEPDPAPEPAKDGGES